MSRRRREKPDSFELLLDTMCNTFGGIIMIALLIALLSRDASSDTEVRRRTEATQRQLQQLAAQVSDAQRLQQQLRTNSAGAEVFELLTERDELRQRIDSAKAAIESNATIVASIPTTSQAAEIERLIAERKTRTNQVRILAEQVERESQVRQRQFRLPRERATGKKTHYFVLRYGKIYPVHIMREGRRDLNNETLQWRSAPSGEAAIPRRDLGLIAMTGLPAFAALFGEIPKETYSIHFLVYNDSIPGFLAARQVPLQRGYDVGWEFLTEEQPIVFSARGEAPPAL